MSASLLLDPVEGGPSRVVVGRPDDYEMKPLPINPEWIIDGAPVARSAQHSENSDGWAGTGVWDCTAGRFHWYFSDESLMILEGEVEVTDDHGLTTVLREGDVAYFAAGSHFVWNVPVYVRKLVFFRRSVPMSLRRVYAVRAWVGRGVRWTRARLKSL